MGSYVSWGNVEGHQEGSGYDFSQEVYNASPGGAINTDLSLDQDAARAVLGAPWRMPTAAEFQELFDNCTHVYTTLNGVNGCLFTSNVNGKTLFFPAAGYYNGTSLEARGASGYYWSNTLGSETVSRALTFSGSSVDPRGNRSRYYGYTVRAVMDPR